MKAAGGALTIVPASILIATPFVFMVWVILFPATRAIVFFLGLAFTFFFLLATGSIASNGIGGCQYHSRSEQYD